MVHHYKVASFHWSSAQTEYKYPYLRPSVVLTHTLGWIKQKKTWFSRRCHVHVTMTKTTHFDYLIPNFLIGIFGLNSTNSGVFRWGAVNCSQPMVNTLFQLVWLSGLHSFQGKVWKIGRRGTEDKGRPAILLGASVRLKPPADTQKQKVSTSVNIFPKIHQLWQLLSYKPTLPTPLPTAASPLLV